MQNKFRYHHYWIYFLTTSWLISTFEHNYFTLSKYTHDVFMFSLPISDITAFLLVLAIDLSIFWSVLFIPYANMRQIGTRGSQVVLSVSTVISILLNVRYMWTASPSDGWFDVSIAIIIGTLVPLYVVIFGWIEGSMTVNEYEFGFSGNGNGNGKVTTEEVINTLRQHPKESVQQIADRLSVSRQTVQYHIAKYKEAMATKSKKE